MEKTTGRLEAFSDGIFGVAITLLALEIGIKSYAGATDQNLWQRIGEDWPEYFTYFNSFATVLLIWMGHHAIIAKLNAADHWVKLLNGLVLFFVVLFPFPTRMVGSFIGTPAVHTAVAFYAGYTGLITLSMLMLNIYIVKHPNLLVEMASVLWFRKMMSGQLIGFIIYEFAAVIGMYYAGLALALTFGMWVFWLINTRGET